MVTMRNRDPRTGWLPTKYCSNVDIRNWVNPKLAPLAASNAILTHLSEVNIDKNFDPIELSHTIKAQVQASITNFKLYSPWLVVEYLERLRRSGMNTLGVSCPGIIASPPGVDRPKVRRFGLAGSFHGSDFFESDPVEVEFSSPALAVGGGVYTSDEHLVFQCYSKGPDSMHRGLINNSIDLMLNMSD